ncbi:hypothetical protein [Paenibacillus pabuli]
MRFQKSMISVIAVRITELGSLQQLPQDLPYFNPPVKLSEEILREVNKQ